MATLEEVPDEILQHIISFLPPEDNLLRVQLLSRRLKRLVDEPILWRAYCRDTFVYWSPSHDFERKLSGNVSNVDWKALFLQRKITNARVSALFEGVLATQVRRIRKFEQICLVGDDAKDFLVEQSRPSDSADDVLARRYHANAILASLRRGRALAAWDELRHYTVPEIPRGDPPANDYVVLERALAALDMFVIKDDEGDIEHTSRLLDDIASRFLSCHPEWVKMTVREQTLALNRWLRAQNLFGMDNPQTEYRNLKNCFIGHALRDQEHPSIHLISSAIYCFVAGRLGLNAHLVAIPSRVHVVVFSRSRQQTLDGERIQDPKSPPVQRMYLDPSDSESEVTKEELRRFVMNLQWTSSLETLLEPARPTLLLRRMVANIKATYTVERPRGIVPARDTISEAAQPPGAMADLFRGSHGENLELAIYGAAWAGLLLSGQEPVDLIDHDRQLAFWSKPRQSEDVWLIDRYLAPLADRIFAAEPGKLVRFMREKSDHPPEVHPRRPSMPFTVGQVVRHVRFDRLAVVYGRKERNGVDFYDIMINDGPLGVTAKAENLELVTDPDSVRRCMSFGRTGLYFKRFDPSTCTFVSNILEEYPDG